MFQGRGADGGAGDLGAQVPKRSLSVGALCLRSALALALAAVVWPLWAKRGVVIGGPEALGLAILWARLTFGRWAAWKSRHPWLNGTCFYIFIGAMWLREQATFDAYRSSAFILADSVIYACAVAALVVPPTWWSARKRARAARTELLAQHATHPESRARTELLAQLATHLESRARTELHAQLATHLESRLATLRQSASEE